MTFRLTTVEAMAGAIERARTANLFVQRTTIPRMYRVTNRDNGNQYVVNFFVRKSDRARFARRPAAARPEAACSRRCCAAALQVSTPCSCNQHNAIAGDRPAALIAPITNSYGRISTAEVRFRRPDALYKQKSSLRVSSWSVPRTVSAGGS